MRDIFPRTDFRLPADVRDRYPALAGVMTLIDVESIPSCIVTVPGTSIYAAYREDGSLDYIWDVEVEKMLYRAPN
ncbi:hypothetical protein [Novosphingobium sp. Fuku2-ISO-50]|jgi:hypothetical protein|uniref:hypothetical protein n=1 Tax=Novosphingobium sp. Fuku2-ISO-50 TaxID=1739114 RepID=UPI00076CA91A|nr:hypothetical protein [Novosphingobium sp. Fuku2-ISO-50]KUR73985.1 hypothetical protein AQZ50_18550 [Novosphingobium sp. Fuku2-ISO-50]